MAYSGIYKPTNPQKYKGNPCRIIYRSLWERKFMFFCDHNDSIIEWGSEEVIIPYRCPTDGRVHRYYPDFYIPKENLIIEVKSQYTLDVQWDKNQAKFNAVKDNGFNFKLIIK
jgi:hypothetical protein